MLCTPSDYKINSLELFHPLIQNWFRSTYSLPTDVQQKAWRAISNSEHVLVSAPTGTGKTLAAFLWALNQLITEKWDTGSVQVLYISPLKALNTDIRENLLTPLFEIRKQFSINNQSIPLIRIKTRSGDTPLNERRSILKHPPEILITTPEGLNIILSSPRTRTILKNLKTVILDEIHAIASDKRGALLSTSIERLVLLSGEFQRIALSATVKPLDMTARFTGGYFPVKKNDIASYEPRPVTIITSEYKKQYQLQIESIQPAFNGTVNGDSFWILLAERLLSIIQRNRTTLIFVNNRRLSERIVMYINDMTDKQYVYSHHGSLSRELRNEVERRLKAGLLKAIVSTSSLEMGIDIGEIDEVVLVGTPSTVSSSLQRIGRAGHSVHKISRCTFIPTHGLDLLYATVMCKLVKDRDIEAIHLIENPLDILAQVMLSMSGTDSLSTDELYEFIRTSVAFNTLPRRQYDLVIMMLTGKYGETRIRELHPRILVDNDKKSIKAKDGMLCLIYKNGGTIPDRGYFNLRIKNTHAKIGELDEEFVWERRIGDTFLMGAQHWRIESIDDQNVEVSLWPGRASMSPFWKADSPNRSYHIACKTSEFIEKWNDFTKESSFTDALQTEYGLDTAAAASLCSFLEYQKLHTGQILPHRHHIIIEHVKETDSGNEPHTIIHTLWGNAVNYPFMLVLSAAWEERYKKQLVSFTSNEALFIQEIITAEDIASLIHVKRLESLLRKSLEQSTFFGARFRENSGRALLLPRSNPSKRIPFWITRQRSKKLFHSIQKYSDFPITIETWRTCLQDEFDLFALSKLTEEISNGEIKISSVESSVPSPFSGTLQYQFTNKFLYEDDTPHRLSSNTSLSQDLIDEITRSPALRPAFLKSDVIILQQKLHRTAEGYNPGNSDELIEWLDERICIPIDEWQLLLSAIKSDPNFSKDTISELIELKTLRIKLPDAATECIVTIKNAAVLCRVFGIKPEDIIQSADNKADPVLQVSKFTKTAITESDEIGLFDCTSLISQWLTFYGPVKIEFLSQVFGFKKETAICLIEELVNQKTIITNITVKDEGSDFFCDHDNCERLLRSIRKSSRSGFKPLSADNLQLFIAQVQGITQKKSGKEGLQSALDKLFNYPLKAVLWENDVFPARISDYYTGCLDSLLSVTNLEWYGCGKEQISFRLFEDRELCVYNPRVSKEEIGFDDYFARYSYSDLLNKTNANSSLFSTVFWKAVWTGLLNSDTYESIRKGIALRFGKENESSSKQLIPEIDTFQCKRPISFNKWKTTRLLPGNWRIITAPESDDDPIYQNDLCKDRIRILLSRYGIIFRELLANELPGFQWPQIFKTLRIMELSGEVLTGHFFDTIPGLQFISHEAFKLLQNTLDEDILYWINAADPASLCGVSIQSVKSDLPGRLSTTHLFYHGKHLVIISRKKGKELECKFTPESKNAIKYCSKVKELAERKVSNINQLKIELINNESIYNSPFVPFFKAAGFTMDYRYLSYWPD